MTIIRFIRQDGLGEFFVTRRVDRGMPSLSEGAAAEAFSYSHVGTVSRTSWGWFWNVTFFFYPINVKWVSIENAVWLILWNLIELMIMNIDCGNAECLQWELFLRLLLNWTWCQLFSLHQISDLMISWTDRHSYWWGYQVFGLL